MPDSYYLAMEFVDGESVGQVLDREKRLDEGRALAIVRSVALALDHAWQNGIVHRDVKPDNILLTRTGKAKLADLGLARSIERRDRLTALGTGIGTPDYMSPEQVRGEADLDIRSDIYSLGATLYNMLTGAAPYDGPTALAVGAQHCTEPPPDPRAKAPTVSDAAADLVLWMMAKKHSLRPQTPEELIGALDAAFPGLAAPRPGSSTLPIPHCGQRAAEPARGARWLVPGLAALAALLALALCAVLLLRPPVREQGKTPPDPPSTMSVEAIAGLKEATQARERAEENRRRAEAALAEANKALAEADARLREETGARSRAEADRLRAREELLAASQALAVANGKLKKEADARVRAEDDRKQAEAELVKAEKAVADADSRAKAYAADRARAEMETVRAGVLLLQLGKDRSDAEAKLKDEREARGRAEAKLVTAEKAIADAHAKFRNESDARARAEDALGKAVKALANPGGAATKDSDPKSRPEADVKEPTTPPGSRLDVRLSPAIAFPDKAPADEKGPIYPLGGEITIRMDLYARPGEERQYFRLEIAAANPNKLPVIQKDVVFICDVSLSTKLSSIVAVREVVGRYLGSLRPTDRFNVILFSEEPRKLFPDFVAPSAERIKAAVGFVDRLPGEIRTDVYRVLNSVVRNVAEDAIRNRPTSIFFISDGRSTSGVRDARRIVNEISAYVKPTFSILPFDEGGGGDRYLLDLLAYRSRGQATFSDNKDRIEAQLEKLFQRYDKPILMQLRFTYTNLAVEEIYPAFLPCLYVDQPVILFGRCMPGQKMTIQIEGRIPYAGRTLQYSATAGAPDPRRDDIAHDWAQQKIHHLVSNMARVGESPDLRAQIERIGREYSVRTPYDR